MADVGRCPLGDVQQAERLTCRQDSGIFENLSGSVFFDISLFTANHAS